MMPSCAPDGGRPLYSLCQRWMRLVAGMASPAMSCAQCNLCVRGDHGVSPRLGHLEPGAFDGSAVHSSTMSVQMTGSACYCTKMPSPLGSRGILLQLINGKRLLCRGVLTVTAVSAASPKQCTRKVLRIMCEHLIARQSAREALR
jgi:hypothetical protein